MLPLNGISNVDASHMGSSVSIDTRTLYTENKINHIKIDLRF